MAYNKYKIEDIEIGDEIYFDSVYSGKLLTQSNFDEYWLVHGKNKNQLLVNLKEDHYWSVDVADVRQMIKKIPQNEE